MRSDIQKVICERPRYNDRRVGGSGKVARVGKAKNGRRNCRMSRQLKFVVDDEGELDELSPSKRPMSRHAREFSDFLAPLEGWIAAQVGRPYDKVFSELSDHLQGNGTLQRHVKGHAEQYLTPPDQVRIINGVACEANLDYYSGIYGGDMNRRQIDQNVVYGDPRDGIVKWGQGPDRRGMLSRYNPKAQQRCYRKLPRTEGTVIVVKDKEGDYRGTLTKRGGKWYWSYNSYEPKDGVRVLYPTPRSEFSQYFYHWVGHEVIASNARLKSLGYRPEKRRARDK